VSKFGLKRAPTPVEIKEPVELVILLIRDDLICSESSALALKGIPIDIVKKALRRVFVRFELDKFIIYFPLINFTKIFSN